MSDNPIPSVVTAVPDRQDADGNNIGISLKQARDAIMERGEQRRAMLSGDLDLEGKRTVSLTAETEQAIEPMAEGWRDVMAEKYPHLAGMSVPAAAQADDNFRREVEDANQSYKAILEGYRRAAAQREDKEFRRLRPQSLAEANGKVEQRFAQDAVAYLIEAKGLTREQANNAYKYGGLGKATEQAKLFDRADAWARDKRELKSLDAKYHLNESVTLREAARRRLLMKRLGRA